MGLELGGAAADLDRREWLCCSPGRGAAKDPEAGCGTPPLRPPWGPPQGPSKQLCRHHPSEGQGAAQASGPATPTWHSKSSHKTLSWGWAHSAPQAPTQTGSMAQCPHPTAAMPTLCHPSQPQTKPRSTGHSPQATRRRGVCAQARGRREWPQDHSRRSSDLLLRNLYRVGWGAQGWNLQKKPQSLCLGLKPAPHSPGAQHRDTGRKTHPHAPSLHPPNPPPLLLKARGEQGLDRGPPLGSQPQPGLVISPPPKDHSSKSTPSPPARRQAWLWLARSQGQHTHARTHARSPASPSTQEKGAATESPEQPSGGDRRPLPPPPGSWSAWQHTGKAAWPPRPLWQKGWRGAPWHPSGAGPPSTPPAPRQGGDTGGRNGAKYSSLPPLLRVQVHGGGGGGGGAGAGQPSLLLQPGGLVCAGALQPDVELLQRLLQLLLVAGKVG